jgi:hypothetical protein
MTPAELLARYDAAALAERLAWLLHMVRSSIAYDHATGRMWWIAGRQRWLAAGAKTGSNRYGRIYLAGRRHRAHHIAWMLYYGRPPAGYIDHIDGNGFNNAITNLRECTCAENQQNRRGANKNNKSGIIGASPTPHGTYKACIGHGGAKLHLGTYQTAEEAHEAYAAAKRRLHSFSPDVTPPNVRGPYIWENVPMQERRMIRAAAPKD